MSLTLAIARDVPVGVVIASWSGRLSRIYHWDVKNDVFSSGQFVRARAEVLAISPNAEYVVYYGEALSKIEQAYVAISHLPYFTALAFFLQFHGGGRSADFVSSRRLDLRTTSYDYKWVEGRDRLKERIDPGCPFEIVRGDFVECRHMRMTTAEDRDRNRLVVAHRDQLIEKRVPEGDTRVIAEFPREAFEEVPPPEWAKEW